MKRTNYVRKYSHSELGMVEAGEEALSEKNHF